MRSWIVLKESDLVLKESWNAKRKPSQPTRSLRNKSPVHLLDMSYGAVVHVAKVHENAIIRTAVLVFLSSSGHDLEAFSPCSSCDHAQFIRTE